MTGRDGRQTSGITTKLIIGYVRRRGGDDAVAAVVERSGIERTVAELEDESSWVSYDAKIALFEAAAHVLGDDRIGLHVGESVLDQSVGSGLKLLLRALGSPVTVLRNAAKVTPKFSTVATVRTEQVKRTSAVVTYEVDPSVIPHRMDCDYTLGIVTQAPVLFGLPPATVVHDECQVRGAARCVYRVRWQRRRRLGRGAAASRTADLEKRLRELEEHSRLLAATTVDLLSPDDLDVVLQRVVDQAARALRAQHFLLVVRPEPDSPERVLHDGIPAASVARLVERALAAPVTDGAAAGAGDGPDRETNLLVVQVASSRRTYGRLAAVLPDGDRFFPEERAALDDYAHHAAAALETAAALTAARRQERIAVSLLELARTLAAATTEEQVAVDLAEAVPRVVGARHASVWRWDDRQQALVCAAQLGLEGPMAQFLGGLRITEHDTPALAEMMLSRRPRHLVAEDLDDEFLATVMTAAGVAESVVVPILVNGTLEGVVGAGRLVGDPPLPAGATLTALLAGIADQGATAFARAQLLEEQEQALVRLQTSEAHVRHLAYHDGLTGLPNWRLLHDRLSLAVLDAERTGAGMAVLFCDLDRFKNVNDGLGHPVGDELLRAVGDRLRDAVGPTGLVARLGGDEFVVVVPDAGDPSDAGRIARRVLEVLSGSVTVAGHELRTSASVGVACYPGDGSDVDTLLRNADAAMYAAKAAGRGTYRRYQPEMNGAGAGLLAVEAALHRALRDGELVVHYQPAVDAVTGEPAVYEALVRWDHPEQGLLLPGAFVPIAEDRGLIADIDRLVLEEACRQLARWRAAGHDVMVAANISAVHLSQPGAADHIAAVVAAAGVPPEAVELEITETAALGNATEVARNLEQLLELGVSLALDDFGTAYAVWSHLKRIPLRRLKIDGSFIGGLPGDRHDAAIVSALVHMAHDIGIKVTAEWVETEEQAAFLRRIGCDSLQGYLFATPAPAAAVALSTPASR